MPLTPEDVQNKRFTTTRFRPGYDEDEVDAFLDEVEAELTRLLQDNSGLRTRGREPFGSPGRHRPQLRPPKLHRPPKARRVDRTPHCARCCSRNGPPTRRSSRRARRPSRSWPRRAHAPPRSSRRHSRRMPRRWPSWTRRRRELEAPGRGPARLRAGVPHPAQGLPRDAAARAVRSRRRGRRASRTGDAADNSSTGGTGGRHPDRTGGRHPTAPAPGVPRLLRPATPARPAAGSGTCGVRRARSGRRRPSGGPARPRHNRVARRRADRRGGGQRGRSCSLTRRPESKSTKAPRYRHSSG